MSVRSVVALAICGAALTTFCARAETVGVSSTEIKIGATFPFSGPASSFGNVGKGLLAYVRMINDRGGINGRKIEFIALDDAYSPPKTVEQTRRLVESDQVAFIFSSVGTPTNSAIVKYLASKKVPQTFIIAGAAKFTNISEYPLVTTAIPSYETEARAYAKRIKSEQPNVKVAILYQNDDFGKDFVNGFRASYKDQFDRKVVLSSFEVAQPTVDSQVVSLKSSGASAYLFAGSAKFAAQSIRKIYELDWKPLQITNLAASSVASVLAPAGLDKAVGLISAAYLKDPSDPRWKEDPGILQYRRFMANYAPGIDPNDNYYASGMQQGILLEALLKQCGDDLSRENIAKQALNIKDLELPLNIPGIRVNTSPSNNQAFTQLTLQRWNGSSWEAVGSVIDRDEAKE